MSLLWAVPPVAVAFAATLVLVFLRETTTVVEELTLQLHRLDEVRVAVADIRAETARTRASVERLRVR